MDGFVTRICEPWLGTWPSAAMSFSVPEPQEIHIVTGCAQPNDLGEVKTDVPWLRVRYEGRTAPVKLIVEVDPAGLEPGQHKGEITVTVPAAFYPELKIPVTLQNN